jgi:hypothetical protein
MFRIICCDRHDSDADDAAIRNAAAITAALLEEESAAENREAALKFVEKEKYKTRAKPRRPESKNI